MDSRICKCRYTHVCMCGMQLLIPELFSDCAVWDSEKSEEQRKIFCEREEKKSENFGMCLSLGQRPNSFWVPCSFILFYRKKITPQNMACKLVFKICFFDQML